MSVRRHGSSQGATLVEVLLVVVVVAVLIGISVPRYKTVKEKAQMLALKADLAELREAQEGFYAEHRRYATDVKELNYTPKNHAVIAISSRDPITGWRAVAVHPLLTGSCFLSSGSETEPGGSTGVECDSFGFANASVEK
jgi:Tfp pilus assembly protein PilE